jgi:hypothetical protein
MGTFSRHHVDCGAHRITGFAQRIHVGLRAPPRSVSGAKKGLPSIAASVLNGMSINRSKLRQIQARITCAEALAQPFLCDGARRDAHRGFARRRTTAAAIVAETVFLPVGVVGMAGAEGLGDVAVILAALVLVADQQRRSACRWSCPRTRRKEFLPYPIRAAA